MSPRELPRPVLLAALLAVLAAAPAAAQTTDPIIITEPDAWSRGRGMAVTEGDTIRVRGVATHASGVGRVTINGVEATLRRDPAFPNLVDFSGFVVGTAGATNALITLVPSTGAPVEVRFDLEVVARARPVQPQPQQRAAEPAREPVQPRMPAANPWGAFRLRGIGYGAAAVGGAVLTMMTSTSESERCEHVQGGQECYLRVEEKAEYRSAGLGLIGVGVAGAAIDALLTSRRAGASRSPAFPGGEQSSTEPRGPQLAVPAVLPQADGRVGLALLRVRF